ncbi:MAG: response regulator [Gemmataceae bacterium]
MATPPAPLPSSGRVLIVDDDPDTRANLCDILELDGYEIETAGTLAEVLARPAWDDVFAILLDRQLPDGTAEELLPRLRQLAPEAAVMIVTGHSDLHGAIAALRQGAFDYILKPINPEPLRASLMRVADRYRLARGKRHSEDAFRTLVEAAPCLIILVRPDFSLLYLNPCAEEVTGHAAGEVIGRNALEQFIPPEYRSAIAESWRRVLAGQLIRGVETPVLCRDGSRRWVLWNGQAVMELEGIPGAAPPPDPASPYRFEGTAVLAIGQDITALKLSQERTLQAERLAAIGQMMTGLAHESGNALARSQACLEMLAMELQEQPEALELVGRIQKAQNHLQQLYDEVRNYAAPLKLEREPWPLDAVWRQAWSNLAVRRQGRDVLLHEETANVNLHTLIDPFRMEQVFRNIFENALAACADPVSIAVTCTEARIDAIPAIRVTIQDNGPGLTPEVRRRIFEPFFTTKTKGTGLGMAIARRIVEAHGGQIDADTTPGASSPGARRFAGASIHLLLPRDSS